MNKEDKKKVKNKEDKKVNYGMRSQCLQCENGILCCCPKNLHNY